MTALAPATGEEPRHTYLIALGSNRRHRRHGSPRDVIHATFEAYARLGEVTRRSSIITTEPLGPSRRRFANAACLVESPLAPAAMLAALQRIERDFGRRRARRWGERVLDCDIVLWNEGRYQTPSLAIPHPAYRERHFVLAPAVQIAPDWRDPVTGASVRQLHARLTARRPLTR